MVAVETSSAPDFGPFLTYLQLCKKTSQKKKKRQRGDIGQNNLSGSNKKRFGEGGPVDEGRSGGKVGVFVRGRGVVKRRAGRGAGGVS